MWTVATIVLILIAVRFIAFLAEAQHQKNEQRRKNSNQF